MGSWEYYADNGASVYPQSSQGSPFNAAAIAVTGDPLTNLYEDLAADGAILQEQTFARKPSVCAGLGVVSSFFL